MAFYPGPDQDAEGGLPVLHEINVTPFVDVMLVQLIVFMVAAPMLVVGVPVNLPRSEAPRLAQVEEPLVVTLTADGRPHLDEASVPREEWPRRLAELAREAPERPLLLRADSGLAYGEAMAVLGSLSRAGFARISLLAEAAP